MFSKQGLLPLKVGDIVEVYVNTTNGGKGQIAKEAVENMSFDDYKKVEQFLEGGTLVREYEEKLDTEISEITRLQIEEEIELYRDIPILFWYVQGAGEIDVTQKGGDLQKGIRLRLINPEEMNNESKIMFNMDEPIEIVGQINKLGYIGTFTQDDQLENEQQWRNNHVFKINQEIDPKLIGNPTDTQGIACEMEIKRTTGGWGCRIPEHGETPEQNEVKQIIETLESMWEIEVDDPGLWPAQLHVLKQQQRRDKLALPHTATDAECEEAEELARKAAKKAAAAAAAEPGPEPEPEPEPAALTPAQQRQQAETKQQEREVARNRHNKRIFMRDLWDNGWIKDIFGIVEGPPVYDNIYNYTHSQKLDEGFSPHATGGGRKKRRKRRKTKKSKSKRKSKRSSKKKKTKKK
jgi:hypothetical protein